MTTTTRQSPDRTPCGQRNQTKGIRNEHNERAKRRDTPGQAGACNGPGEAGLRRGQHERRPGADQLGAVALGGCAMNITCTVEFVASRAKWRVAIYRDGKWRKDEWFNIESFARLYAEWREALG